MPSLKSVWKARVRCDRGGAAATGMRWHAVEVERQCIALKEGGADACLGHQAKGGKAGRPCGEE